MGPPTSAEVFPTGLVPFATCTETLGVPSRSPEPVTGGLTVRGLWEDIYTGFLDGALGVKGWHSFLCQLRNLDENYHSCPNSIREGWCEL